MSHTAALKHLLKTRCRGEKGTDNTLASNNKERVQEKEQAMQQTKATFPPTPTPDSMPVDLGGKFLTHFSSRLFPSLLWTVFPGYGDVPVTWFVQSQCNYLSMYKMCPHHLVAALPCLSASTQPSITLMLDQHQSNSWGLNSLISISALFFFYDSVYLVMLTSGFILGFFMGLTMAHL